MYFMGPWKGGVRSRFLWRGHGEVTKISAKMRGQRILREILRGLRGHGEVTKFQNLSGEVIKFQILNGEVIKFQSLYGEVT